MSLWDRPIHRPPPLAFETTAKTERELLERASYHLDEAEQVYADFHEKMQSFTGGYASTPIPLTVVQFHATLAASYIQLASYLS